MHTFNKRALLLSAGLTAYWNHGSFFSLIACISPSSTVEVSQKFGSFLVRLRLISLCPSDKVYVCLYKCGLTRELLWIARYDSKRLCLFVCFVLRHRVFPLPITSSKIEVDIKDGKTSHPHRLEELIVSKWPPFQKQRTDVIQFKSKFQVFKDTDKIHKYINKFLQRPKKGPEHSKHWNKTVRNIMIPDVLKFYYNSKEIKYIRVLEQKSHVHKWDRTEDPSVHSHKSSYVLIDREAKIKHIQWIVRGKLNFNIWKHESRSLPLNPYKTQRQMDQSAQHRPDTLKPLEVKAERMHQLITQIRTFWVKATVD